MYCSECKIFVEKDFEMGLKSDGKKKILEDNPDETANPTVDAACSKCGNKKAYFAFVQTRASDEAPTKFFKCTKCGKMWRQYD